MRFATPVMHPEWLQDAIEGADKTFEMAIQGKLPESMAGWMITVSCMRVLRAVYGDDLSTVIALRRSLMEKMTPEAADASAVELGCKSSEEAVKS